MSEGSQFAEVNGTRLHYRLDGPAGAPVLLLSNSLGTNLGMWGGQMAALTARYRVLRYDSRGHGRSAVPAGGYTIDQLGRDAVGLLDHLGFDRVAFCGLSKGGMVGMWLGVHAPERVSRLALTNTAPHMPPPDLWDTRIRTVSEQGMTSITEGVVSRWFTQGFQERAPAEVEPIRQMLLSTDPVGYCGCCHAIRDMDQRGDLSRIKAPTLVIGGTVDPSTPPHHSEEIARGIAGSKLVMLEAAHLSNIEQRAGYTAALLAFLKG
jgi:3-oxoadipate enol-lactonase